jgi:hypothetical protein
VMMFKLGSDERLLITGGNNAYDVKDHAFRRGIVCEY